MEFTNLSEEQKQELKFRYLKAQLLQDTSMGIISANSSNNSLLSRYQTIIEDFRSAVIKSENLTTIEHCLENYYYSVSNFLDPNNAKTKEEKKILKDFREINRMRLGEISPELQQLGVVSRVSDHLGFYEKIDGTNLFNRDEAKAKHKVEKTNIDFDKKMDIEISDELFGETSHYFNHRIRSVTDLKTLVSMDLQEIQKVTSPVHKHPEYDEIEKVCQDFMKKYSITHFQFDISSSETFLDFKKNMLILDKTISNACEHLGISNSFFGDNKTYFRYYNKTNDNLGTYSADLNEFSINANSLFNLQKKIMLSSDPNEVSKTFDNVSSTIAHEWTHLFDAKLLNKIQSIQVDRGLTPQFLHTAEDDFHSKSGKFLSEVDAPVYGLHGEVNKNLKEAVSEFREIQKTLLTSSSVELSSEKGARREFMEHFWKGATSKGESWSALSSEKKNSLLTEKSFDVVFAYFHNPNDKNNQKRFNSLMKQQKAELLHEGFFYHSSKHALKVPLTPDLLDVHTKMVKSLESHQQVYDEGNKSDFLKNAEILDVSVKGREGYFSRRVELFARFTESNLFGGKGNPLAYANVSEDEKKIFRERYTSIIAKAFGISSLNDVAKQNFLEKNSDYKEPLKAPSNKFLESTKKMLQSIKSALGIEKEEDYQLPLSNDAEFNLKISIERDKKETPLVKSSLLKMR